MSPAPTGTRPAPPSHAVGSTETLIDAPPVAAAACRLTPSTSGHTPRRPPARRTVSLIRTVDHTIVVQRGASPRLTAQQAPGWEREASDRGDDRLRRGVRRPKRQVHWPAVRPPKRRSASMPGCRRAPGVRSAGRVASSRPTRRHRGRPHLATMASRRPCRQGLAVSAPARLAAVRPSPPCVERGISRVSGARALCTDIGRLACPATRLPTTWARGGVGVQSNPPLPARHPVTRGRSASPRINRPMPLPVLRVHDNASCAAAKRLDRARVIQRTGTSPDRPPKPCANAVHAWRRSSLSAARSRLTRR